MIGDKIVCKEVYNYYKPLEITINNIYTVISEDNIGYRIINDLGKRRFFTKDKFISLKEDRKKKLNEIWYKTHPVNL